MPHNYTERKLKNKNQAGPGNEASKKQYVYIYTVLTVEHVHKKLTLDVKFAVKCDMLLEQTYTGYFTHCFYSISANVLFLGYQI